MIAYNRDVTGSDYDKPGFTIKDVKFDVVQPSIERPGADYSLWQPGEFSNNAVYVSKPYKVNGNISQISIMASENYPVFINDLSTNDTEGSIDAWSTPINSSYTSIEYYVSNAEHPTLDQWKPILPMGQNIVKNELLFFSDVGTANLRFKAMPEPATVYCNNVPLTKYQWTFANGCTAVIITDGYLPSNQYTIRYVPSGDPHNIDFSNNAATAISETFDGTDRNMTLKLKYKPFVDYGKINAIEGYDPNTKSYVPIKVTLKDTDIIGPNKKVHTIIEQYDGTGKKCGQYPSDTLPCPYTKNVTNYISEDSTLLNSYDPAAYPYFEYMQDGDKVIFTETFNKANIRENMKLNHGNAKIQVDYQYTSSTVRTKIIMRRTTAGIYKPITPSVREFTLRMKVL